jgi:hypothetical protein
MEMILFLIVALAAFNLVTFVWGFDSRDGIKSTQSELRQQWPASY